MNKGLVGIICVLSILTTGFMGCVPVSADVNTAIIDDSMILEMITASTHYHDSNIDLDYTDCYNWMNSDVHNGLWISNINYHNHLIISNAYQHGIRWQRSDYGWSQPDLNINGFSSCTPNTWTDSTGWYHNNHFIAHYYNIKQVDYVAQIYIQTNLGSETKIQFKNYLWWQSGSGYLNIYEFDAWWKIDFKLNTNSDNAYWQNDAPDTCGQTGGLWHQITTEWSGRAQWDMTSEKISDSGNQNHYVCITEFDKAASVGTHKFSAFQTIENYHGFDVNDDDHETVTHPIGSDYIQVDMPTSGQQYWTSVNWYPVWA